MDRESFEQGRRLERLVNNIRECSSAVKEYRAKRNIDLLKIAEESLKGYMKEYIGFFKYLNPPEIKEITRLYREALGINSDSIIQHSELFPF